MYLSITSTAPSATDLGFLLHKHPERAQELELPFGTAHIFYPETSQERCTIALLVEVDPIALVRGRRYRADGFALTQYVNDRPYAASSLLAVAVGRAFRTAMNGKCDARPELVDAKLPLEVHLPALPCDGDPDLAQRLFAPLGWTVEADPIGLDPENPAWGDSRYVDLHLTGELTVAAALSHIYVLLPVLDNAKHYWVTEDEVDKLIRVADSWLPAHPEKDFILKRYLAHQRSLVFTAVDRLTESDPALGAANVGAADIAAKDESAGETSSTPTETAEVLHAVQPAPVDQSLAVQRRLEVLQALRDIGATRIVDLGCGEGALLRELIEDHRFTRIIGADVSARALELAERRLHLDRMPDRKRERLQLIQSSATYRDSRLDGFDAIVLMEVIEHLDLPRLPSLERAVFGQARPRAVIVTTPNAEYNVRYPSLGDNNMRHLDHRFEWTRLEFLQWAEQVADSFRYEVAVRTVGEVDAEVGAPTQMAIFTMLEGDGSSKSGSTSNVEHIRATNRLNRNDQEVAS